VASHLSRLQFKKSAELPINDYMRDDILLKVSTIDPWYANIVNYNVAGYIHLGADKKKIIRDSRLYLWDDPYLYWVCADGLLWRCIPAFETWKMSYPIPRKRERSLRTCAQDVQITRMATM
jgi:hypothetical protein